LAWYIKKAYKTGFYSNRSAALREVAAFLLPRSPKRKEGLKRMAEGTLKWLNEATGYGLIRPADGSRDLFMRRTDAAMGGPDALDEGVQVSYEVKQGRNGMRATRVSKKRAYSWRDSCLDRHEGKEARREYYAGL
jgi:CspA family cold shock protein